MNSIKKLWSQKEKEDQNKEDVTKLIEEKFNQLEKRLTSIKKILRTCQTVLLQPGKVKMLYLISERSKTEKLNGVWCQ